MTQFGAELRSRVAAARTAMASAQDIGDDYLVEVLAGELESLSRLAAEHQVALDDESAA